MSESRNLRQSGRKRKMRVGKEEKKRASLARLEKPYFLWEAHRRRRGGGEVSLVSQERRGITKDVAIKDTRSDSSVNPGGVREVIKV